MKQEPYYLLSVIIGSLTAIFAIIIGVLQGIINKRLKDLQDYVAISIAPLPDSQLKVSNVGKSNLYLHKWEIGSMNESFDEPLLIPISQDAALIIAITKVNIGRNRTRLYLTDEKKKKYISSGDVIIEQGTPIPLSHMIPQFPINIQQSENQTAIGGSGQIVIPLMVKVHNYRIKKYKWKL